MILKECERCRCPLDPGEGRLCDDCAEEMDSVRQREKELDRMVRSTDYKQMKMEEFLK